MGKDTQALRTLFFMLLWIPSHDLSTGGSQGSVLLCCLLLSDNMTVFPTPVMP